MFSVAVTAQTRGNGIKELTSLINRSFSRSKCDRLPSFEVVVGHLLEAISLGQKPSHPMIGLIRQQATELGTHPGMSLGDLASLFENEGFGRVKNTIIG